ncbi:MAG TPA: hypothetical protein VHV55_15465 [Pirellulales bacterium]|nr:hypothetical protein [Pirellulales bacterium]
MRPPVRGSMRRQLRIALACILSFSTAFADDLTKRETVVAGIAIRATKPLKLGPIATVCLGDVPDILKGARAIAPTFDRENQSDTDGRIDLEFKRAQPVYVAVSWSNERGAWSKEVMTKSDFVRTGWMYVGELPTRSSSGKVEQRGLFWREAKAGDKFQLRTRKAIAPMIITPRAGAPAPTPGDPRPADSK